MKNIVTVIRNSSEPHNDQNIMKKKSKKFYLSPICNIDLIC